MRVVHRNGCPRLAENASLNQVPYLFGNKPDWDFVERNEQQR
jgi:hypothetical protein